MAGSDGFVNIHGVRLDRLDRSAAAARVAEALRRDGPAAPFAVFTPNAEIIYRCSKDRRLAALINSGDLNIPDGVGVVWAARRLGSPLSARVPGIELADAVFGARATDGLRVYLLGGRPGVAGTAAEKLAARYPGLNVCGARHGYFDPRGPENAEVIHEITAAAPDLVVVCLGFPRQEEWIVNNRAALPCVKVMMALGGSLDVWSGQVRRAPGIFRAAGLEWLWRICRHPSRFKRAGALPAFVCLTLREARRVRCANRSP